MTKPDAHTLLIDQFCHFICLLRISGHRPLGTLHEVWKQIIACLKDVLRALRGKGYLDSISKDFSSTWIHLKFEKSF